MRYALSIQTEYFNTPMYLRVIWFLYIGYEDRWNWLIWQHTN
jgi:hypothetical protein